MQAPEGPHTAQLSWDPRTQPGTLHLIQNTTRAAATVSTISDNKGPI